MGHLMYIRRAIVPLREFRSAARWVWNDSSGLKASLVERPLLADSVEKTVCPNGLIIDW